MASDGSSAQRRSRPGSSQREALLENFNKCLKQLSGRLDPFFLALGDFRFSQATSILSAKSDLSRLIIWNELMAPFNLTTKAERAYYDLAYIRHGAEKKLNTIKVMYAQVSSGVKKIITAFGNLASSEPEMAALVVRPISLLRDVCELVECRLEMISVYHRLALIDSETPPDFEYLCQVTGELYANYSARFNHPSLVCIKDNLLSEVHVLESVFTTNIHISAYRFKETIFSLGLLRQFIRDWRERCEKRTRWNPAESVEDAESDAELERPGSAASTPMRSRSVSRVPATLSAALSPGNAPPPASFASPSAAAASSTLGASASGDGVFFATPASNSSSLLRSSAHMPLPPPAAPATPDVRTLSKRFSSPSDTAGRMIWDDTASVASASGREDESGPSNPPTPSSSMQSLMSPGGPKAGGSPHKLSRKDRSEWRENAPFMLKWAARSCGKLMSKATFYFFEILKRQNDFVNDNLTAKRQRLLVDYVHEVDNFARKTEASHVCLIYDCTGLPQSVKLPHNSGYRCPVPGKEPPPPQGLQTFPAIFTHPLQSSPTVHWPNVVSLYWDQRDRLETYSQIVHLYDQSSHATYYLILVEPRIFLAIIFDRQKKSNDFVVTDFMQNMVNSLRFAPLLS